MALQTRSMRMQARAGEKAWPRYIDGIASTQAVDSWRTIIVVEEVDLSCLVLWQHRRGTPVGRAEAVTTSGEQTTCSLRIEDVPAAREMMEYVDAGLLRDMSIGFDTLRSEWVQVEGGERVEKLYVRVSEITICDIGSNPDAQITSVRSAEPSTEETTMAAAKAKMAEATDETTEEQAPAEEETQAKDETRADEVKSLRTTVLETRSRIDKLELEQKTRREPQPQSRICVVDRLRAHPDFASILKGERILRPLSQCKPIEIMSPLEALRLRALQLHRRVMGYSDLGSLVPIDIDTTPFLVPSRLDPIMDMIEIKPTNALRHRFSREQPKSIYSAVSTTVTDAGTTSDDHLDVVSTAQCEVGMMVHVVDDDGLYDFWAEIETVDSATKLTLTAVLDHAVDAGDFVSFPSSPVAEGTQKAFGHHGVDSVELSLVQLPVMLQIYQDELDAVDGIETLLQRLMSSDLNDSKAFGAYYGTASIDGMFGDTDYETLDWSDFSAGSTKLDVLLRARSLLRSRGYTGPIVAAVAEEDYSEIETARGADGQYQRAGAAVAIEATEGGLMCNRMLVRPSAILHAHDAVVGVQGGFYRLAARPRSGVVLGHDGYDFSYNRVTARLEEPVAGHSTDTRAAFLVDLTTAP